mgnify:CR=1 FL=1
MKITKTQLKQIIKEELKKTLEVRSLDEGLENVSPENLQIVADAAKHFIEQPEVLMGTIGTAGVALVNQLASLFKVDGPPEPAAGGGLGGPGDGPRRPTPEEISKAKDFELDEANKKDSHDEIRRRIEKSMGLEPGSIQSDEELKDAEKKRKEKAKSKPQTKSPKAPKRRPKYGHGGTHETWS